MFSFEHSASNLKKHLGRKHSDIEVDGKRIPEKRHHTDSTNAQIEADGN